MLKIPEVYEKHPSLRNQIRKGLLKSLSYMPKEGRVKFSPLFSNTGEAPIWDILSRASKDKGVAIAEAFYQLCDHYKVVIEYTSFGHKPTLDEIVAGRKHPKINDFGGSIACVNAQSYVYKILEKRVINGKLLSSAQVKLLSSNRLKRLRNTTFARHGRKFKSPTVSSWFQRMSWYKQNDAYANSLLTEIDKLNINVILLIEVSG